MPPILLPPDLEPAQEGYGADIARALPVRDGDTVVLPDGVTFVFVVFSNRSGSSFLCELLASTGFFNPAGEPLNVEEVVRGSAARGLRSFSRYFAAVAGEQARNGHFVVKAGIEQLAALAQHGVLPRIVGRSRFIVVERVDKLAQAISWRIAQMTGRYTAQQAGNGREPHYDGAALRASIAQTVAEHALIDRFMELNGLVPFHVTYEMLAAYPLMVGRMLCAHLGQPALQCDPARVRLARQATELNRSWRARLLAEQAAPRPVVRSRPVAPGDQRTYRRATLDQLAGDAATQAPYLPEQAVVVPPLAFGDAGSSGPAAQGFRVLHPAVPAWQLRNAVVHGGPGVVTLGDRVVAESLDGVALHPIQGADRMADGGLRLPDAPDTASLSAACHLLGSVLGAYPSWLLDLLARFPPSAGAATGPGPLPVALLAPLDMAWKADSLRAVLPARVPSLLLPGDGRVAVQRLLYVPRLGDAVWAMHPATLPIFEAVRTAIVGPEAMAGSRRLFVVGGAATTLAGEADMAARAQQAGFERVVPDAMPFAARVQAFAQASHIVAAGGPALANLVFCRPGTLVCELREVGQAGWTWRHLAALRGLRYGCAVVQSGPFGGDVHGRFAALLGDRRFRDG